MSSEHARLVVLSRRGNAGYFPSSLWFGETPPPRFQHTVQRQRVSETGVGVCEVREAEGALRPIAADEYAQDL